MRYRFVFPSTGVDTLGAKQTLTDLRPQNVREVWQAIWGVKKGALVYQDWPTAVRIGGPPRLPEATSTNRYVGWTDQHISPYDSPSFDTEFFILRSELLPDKDGNFEEPVFQAYNPTFKPMRPELRFDINRMTVRELEERPSTFRRITLEVRSVADAREA